MLQICMLPAGNGDCFLVTHRGKAETNIIIDGGYRRTHMEILAPVLTTLARDQRIVDLVIATHIDTDHIEGLLQLFADLESARTLPVVKEVWHNSLRSLGSSMLPRKPLSPADIELFTEIHRDGYPASKQRGASEIAAAHAHSLSSRISRIGIKWNGTDGSIPIVARTVSPLSAEVTLEVMGPTPNRLGDLRDWWIAQLKHRGINGTPPTTAEAEDVYEFLMARNKEESSLVDEISSRNDPRIALSDIYTPDRSITNASSISVVIVADGKTLLMLGDSCAEDFIDAQNRPFSSPPRLFNAIKLSHHGSHRNTSPELLAAIDAQLFLISTDGDTHNHPSIAVLRAIVDRPASFARTLLFNYHTEASEYMQTYTSASCSPFRVEYGDGSPHIVQ